MELKLNIVLSVQIFAIFANMQTINGMTSAYEADTELVQAQRKFTQLQELLKQANLQAEIYKNKARELDIHIKNIQELLNNNTEKNYLTPLQIRAIGHELKASYLPKELMTLEATTIEKNREMTRVFLKFLINQKTEITNPTHGNGLFEIQYGRINSLTSQLGDLEYQITTMTKELAEKQDTSSSAPSSIEQITNKLCQLRIEFDHTNSRIRHIGKDFLKFGTKSKEFEVDAIIKRIKIEELQKSLNVKKFEINSALDISDLKRKNTEAFSDPEYRELLFSVAHNASSAITLQLTKEILIGREESKWRAFLEKQILAINNLPRKSNGQHLLELEYESAKLERYAKTLAAEISKYEEMSNMRKLGISRSHKKDKTKESPMSLQEIMELAASMKATPQMLREMFEQAGAASDTEEINSNGIRFSPRPEWKGKIVPNPYRQEGKSEDKRWDESL